MDLAEWCAAGRWVGLLELIDNLPTACRLNEAIVNDPTAAKAIAESQQGKERDPYAPRTAEWDLTATLLSEIANGLQVLTAATIKVNGGRPGNIKPFPTPRTKIQAAMKAAEREWAEGFVQQLGFSPGDI